MNIFGMWVYKREYSCDCLECIDKMANDLNSTLKDNFMRIWVGYFSNVVDSATVVDTLVYLTEIYDRHVTGVENVPKTLAEYCAAVCDELDMRFEEIFDCVNQAVCTVV